MSSPPVLAPAPLGSSMRYRFEFVNLIRAFICLGIMLRHFSIPSQFARHWPQFANSALWIPATECFLVVSGYFLAHMFRPSESQYLSLSRFFRRRMFRIMIPYWVALLLAYTLPLYRIAQAGWVLPDEYRPEQILANIFCVPDAFQFRTPMLFYWTISTLIQGYVLWALSFWVIRRILIAFRDPNYEARTGRAMMGVAFALTLVLGPLYWGGVVDTASWEFPRWCFYPAVGAIAYWIGRKNLPIAAALPVLIAMSWGAWWSESPRPLFGELTAVVLYIGSRIGRPIGTRAGRGLVAMGERSFSIYLMHGLVGPRVSGTLERMSVCPDTPFAAVGFVLAAILGSIAAGFLMYRFVEKPMADRASTIVYRR